MLRGSRNIFFLTAFVLGILCAESVVADAPTAIGLFTRRAETPASKEIILRFPIFLSKAYARAKRGSVIYPHEFSRRRADSQVANQVKYTPDEYKKLKSIIDSGNLITGEIYEYEEKKKTKNGEKANTEDENNNAADVPLDKKLVFVKLYHYNSATNKIVTLRIYSKPESIVIDMVRQVMAIETDRYLAYPINPGSRLALIAPLDAIAMNNFYMKLINEKFQVRALSGNDLTGGAANELAPLSSVVSTRVSYETVRDETPDKPLVLSPALDIEAAFAEEDDYQKLYQSAGVNFDVSLRNTLQKIHARTQADYLLVLRPDGKNSFARGFDLNLGGMVWFQDTFPATSSATEDVLSAMVAEMQRVTPTLKEEQFVAIAEEKDKMSSQGANGGLASVAILDFYDRTDSPLYNWLSTSLSIAVDDSMKKIFEFDRNNEKKSNEAGARYFKSPADITAARLKEFKTATGADYIIFGFYSLNKASGNLIIESKVYDLMKNKQIGGAVTESVVDVSMFNAVDEISQGIVQDIFTMTQKQGN
ncbi:MAG: hypothetical protein JSR44_04905 [Spirochaetes bacterium]|nr:hypothetical protein [Spirochaetota bacterium]